MRSESVSDPEAAFDKVLGLSFDAMTDTEKLALQNRMERNLRRAPLVEHRLVGALAAEADPHVMGGTSLTDVLSTRPRISKRDASRRIKEAADLGPRTAFTGEPLDPVLPDTACRPGARGDRRRPREDHPQVLPPAARQRRLPNPRARRSRPGARRGRTETRGACARSPTG